jgi:alkylhydroperoxidase family enzyme
VLVTREPAGVSRDEIDRLRSHGWSDAAIHDAIQVISFFNYINRVADAVGIEDEPEWSRASP